MAVDPLTFVERAHGLGPVRRPRPRALQLTPQEEDSLIRRLGRASMGGIAMLGSALDIPGSMARDVFSGENPLDQLLTPFSPENRVTGREFLRRAGMVGPSDTYGNFAAGIGAEIAMDPLTYLTLGASALGKAGQAAKAAGLMKELPKAAKGVGPRVGRMTTTPRQLTAVARDPAEALTRFTRAGGTAAQLDEPLGGLFGFGLPFRDPAFTFGRAGGLAEPIARGMDITGHAIRTSLPVRTLASMFDPSTKGALTIQGQRLAQDVGLRTREGKAVARQDVAGIATEFDKTGYFNVTRTATSEGLSPAQASERVLQRTRQASRYLEGIDTTWTGPAWVKPRLDRAKQLLNEIQPDEIAAGLKSPILDDVVASYFPRERFRFPTGTGTLPQRFRYAMGQGRERLFETTTPFQKGRLEFLKHHGGGTDILQELSIDPIVSGYAHRVGRGGKLSDENVEFIRQYIVGNYVGVGRISLPMTDSQWEQLARWVGNLDPRHADLRIPAFETNPLKALLSRLEHGRSAIAASEGVQDLFVDSAMAMRHNLDEVTAFEAIDEMGLTDVAKERVLNKLRDKFPALLRKHTLPRISDIPDEPWRITKGEFLSGRPSEPVGFINTLTRNLSQTGPPGLNREATQFGNQAATAIVERADDGTPLAVAVLTDIGGKMQVTGLGRDFNKGIASQRASLRVLNEALRQGVDEIPIDSLSADAAALVHHAYVENAVRAGKTVPADVLADYPKAGRSKVVPIVEGINALKRIYVPRESFADAQRFMQGFTVPENINAFVQGMDWFTNLFKIGVTALWPAFHMRNFISGMYQNFVGQAFDIRSLRDSDALLRGGTVRGLGESPLFRGLNDAEATQRLRELLFAHDVVGARQGMIGETLGEQGASMLAIPGTQPFFSPRPLGTTLGQRLNPLSAATPGVFAPERIGRDIGNYVEGMNRVTPFINLLRKGVDPAEAARRVKLMQVDYTARATVDPVARRLIPFWSFTRGVVPFTVQQLMERPGGRLGRTVMATARARRPEELTPDYVASTASIPLPAGPSGQSRYLTGLGLMFEDPLSFLGTGMQGAGLEALSRLNPLLKGPLEFATGQSFFQRGPLGGRPLENLDPALGRTLANIAGRDEPVPTPRLLELALSNLPTSRALSTARTLSDERKGLLGNLLNIGTGFRVTDVSPAAEDAILKERAQKAMKLMGGREFRKIWIPADEIAEMPPQQQIEALRFNALMNALRGRRQERQQQVARR